MSADAALAYLAGQRVDVAERRDGCPHCPDGHYVSQPWGVYVAPDVDGDGQPTHLVVMPTAGAHVAESDAEWVRRVLNAALAERDAEVVQLRTTLAEVSTERDVAQVRAEAAEAEAERLRTKVRAVEAVLDDISEYVAEYIDEPDCTPGWATRLTSMLRRAARDG